MNRSAQAAMEFLMTYGWAIIALLVAIGALIYFGASDTTYFVPDSCYIEPPFSCMDSRVDTSGLIQLQIKNNYGREMAEANITLNPLDCTISSIAARSYTQTILANGKMFNESNFGVLEFQCDLGTEPTMDEFFEADITIQYRVRDQITWHTLTGTLKTRVEQ